MATSKIKSPFVKRTYSKTGITENTYYKTETVDVSLSGYTPIAIASARSYQALVYFFNLTLDGNTLNVGLAYANQQNLNNASYVIEVLYV